MAAPALVQTDPIESDRDLATRHRYGDEEAFEEAYNRFEAMVYTLAPRMGGNEAEEADCTQETYLRVLRYLAKYRGKSNLETWVFRSALNCCRSRYRSVMSSLQPTESELRVPGHVGLDRLDGPGCSVVLDLVIDRALEKPLGRL